MTTTILVPTDFSECATMAAFYAELLARPLKARIVVAHVKPDNVLPHGDEDVDDPADRRLQSNLEQILAESEGPPVDHKLRRGNPSTEILKLVEENGVDLIVMGTHGQTGSPDASLGAIADAVVMRADCQVIAVKALQSEID